MKVQDLPTDAVQAISLALARLAVERPGWLEYLTQISNDLGPEFKQSFDLLYAMQRERTVPHLCCLSVCIAVQEGELILDEVDLRLTVLVMSHLQRSLKEALRSLAGAVLEKKPSAALRAGMVERDLQAVWNAMRSAPAKYLGPENTPGNPEYEVRRQRAMKLLNTVEQRLGWLPSPQREVLNLDRAEWQALVNLVGYFESCPDPLDASFRPTLALAKDALARHTPHPLESCDAQS